MKLLSKWCNSHKSILRYIVFGVATTVINVVVYDICNLKIKLGTVISTVIAWEFAVLFAYFTNRKFVFKSTAVSYREQISEFVKFVCGRFSTGIVDIWGMYLIVDCIGVSGTVAKLIMNILVIILNYIFISKMVFK